MVFTSLALMVRARGPDEFWRKRKIFKLAAVKHLSLTQITSNGYIFSYLFIIFSITLGVDVTVTQLQSKWYTEL